MNINHILNRLHKTHSLLVSIYWRLKGCGLNALWPIRRPGGAWQKSFSLQSPLLASLQNKDKDRNASGISQVSGKYCSWSSLQACVSQPATGDLKHFTIIRCKTNVISTLLFIKNVFHYFHVPWAPRLQKVPRSWPLSPLLPVFSFSFPRLLGFWCLCGSSTQRR